MAYADDPVPPGGARCTGQGHRRKSGSRPYRARRRRFVVDHIAHTSWTSWGTTTWDSARDFAAFWISPLAELLAERRQVRMDHDMRHGVAAASAPNGVAGQGIAGENFLRVLRDNDV